MACIPNILLKVPPAGRLTYLLCGRGVAESRTGIQHGLKGYTMLADDALQHPRLHTHSSGRLLHLLSSHMLPLTRPERRIVDVLVCQSASAGQVKFLTLNTQVRSL